MPVPLISVIVPCYNSAATLRVAVESVLAQGYSDFELLIVDDGSSDDSGAVAAALIARDRRVRLIRQSNAGPAAARNRGIAEAQGTFLAFLDADDRWAPDLLGIHLAHFRSNPSCGVAFARIRFYDPSLAHPGRVSATVKALSLAQTLGENPVCTTSNLMARSVVFAEVGGFDPELTHGEDQEWVARVLATTRWHVRGLSQVLVDYRTSPAGLSADLTRMHAGWLGMMRKVQGYAPREAKLAGPEATALFHRYLARRALRTGQASSALQPMLCALRSSPRAMLFRQPLRTLMTLLGVLAALLPGNPARRLLAR